MSRIEALRLGWKSAYLPIVGAQAQHAPEDIPNVYKQREHLGFRHNAHHVLARFQGLGVRQRLQFMQMAIFYLHSFATILFMLCISVTLFRNIYPFRLRDKKRPFASGRWWLPPSSSWSRSKATARSNPVWRLREMAVSLAPIMPWHRCGRCLAAQIAHTAIG
ncbi:MAG: hypothetical protein R2855_13530 [Thermomicrobiales bacterium]